MGKWLLGEPKLLVLDDPTQAVDVGARAAILEATRKAAQQGTAILLCSAEVEDLAAVCDRVLVLEDGVVARELTGPLTSEDDPQRHLHPRRRRRGMTTTSTSLRRGAVRRPGRRVTPGRRRRACSSARGAWCSSATASSSSGCS